MIPEGTVIVGDEATVEGTDSTAAVTMLSKGDLDGDSASGGTTKSATETKASDDGEALKVSGATKDLVEGLVGGSKTSTPEPMEIVEDPTG